MSLNWKEINLILEELELEGAQIQGVVQSAFDTIIFRVYKKAAKQILVSLGSGVCRIHETFTAFQKTEKPLRFAQFLNSRIINGRITEARQLGENRIVKLTVKRGEYVYNMYARLWSNAANLIVADEDGNILDAMRRLPKRGEVTGGKYKGIENSEQRTGENEERRKKKEEKKLEYSIREFHDSGNEGKTFNQKIDEYYTKNSIQGIGKNKRLSRLSIEGLKEHTRRTYDDKILSLQTVLEKLRKKEAEFPDSKQYKNYGDLILSNIASVKKGDKWLEAETSSGIARIELDPLLSPSAMAEKYFTRYKKSKNALSHIREEIASCENEIQELSNKLNRLLEEDDPLVLAKFLKTQKNIPSQSQTKKEKSRPGLSFMRGDWLIFLGRDAKENDELLRRHVNGNDYWLHARDYHGSYVFIKHRTGKTVPLEILLDAGNLALYYSKGRNNGEGNLFYTQVKYLRRAKTAGKAKKGLVIPTQEKNFFVKLDKKRINSLKNSTE